MQPNHEVAPVQMQPAKPTNGFAITALVTSLVFAPLGIVFGHIALRQIAKTGENGRGLAVGGLVLGYLLTTISAIILVVWVANIGSFMSEGRGSTSSNSVSLPPPSAPNPYAEGVQIEVPSGGPDLNDFKPGDCLEIWSPTTIKGHYKCNYVDTAIMPAAVYKITHRSSLYIDGVAQDCKKDYVKTENAIFCLELTTFS